jgi:arsenite methyltransferase
MSTAGIVGTLIPELTTGESSSRIPEPDLVMDDPDKVSAFVRAGRETAIVAPTYLFSLLTYF